MITKQGFKDRKNISCGMGAIDINTLTKILYEVPYARRHLFVLTQELLF